MKLSSKFLVATVCLLLVAGALIIRHQEAGYLAYLKGDLEAAEIEFLQRQDNPGGWESYFVGLFYHNHAFKKTNKKKAASAFLNSARLGNIEAAIRYIELLSREGDFKGRCSILKKLIDKSTQTHVLQAVIIKAQHLRFGPCYEKNITLFAHYYKWAGEISPSFGSNFADLYEKMNAREKQKFEELKFTKPTKINDATFLKYFFEHLKDIQIN